MITDVLVGVAAKDHGVVDHDPAVADWGGRLTIMKVEPRPGRRDVRCRGISAVPSCAEGHADVVLEEQVGDVGPGPR